MIAQYYPWMVAVCLGIFGAVLLIVSIQDSLHDRN
ncbi:hypothetical protein M529_16975 [Sphingobium ummariense RL-3]|uniref:Uncharacterized protein n=1 Tax=Sphingobium ummariense RL-3 TaxID=1346791 RepID=T0KBV8_9SPHN|nr:hypothetical protein M529_16975 [Sphingobium ummariense RL-3]